MTLRRHVATLGFIAALLLTTPYIALAQFECDRFGTADVRTGSLLPADPTQSGRVFRDGLPSGCNGGVPGSPPIAGTYHYDAHNFTNTTGADACVRVLLDATGCGGGTNLQANGYTSFNPANVSTNLVGKPGYSTAGTGSFSFPVASGANFQVVVHEIVANSGCANYSISVTYNTSCRQAGFDRGNDGSADLNVWRPSNGTWYSATASFSPSNFSVIPFGLGGDIVSAGDYTGTNAVDYAVYRPSTNTFYYGNNSSTPGSNFTAVQWGSGGDVQTPGDYDGDGKTDIAVWRPSNGTWYILQSSSGTFVTYYWGTSGDTPVWGDYDGDLRADLGIVRTDGGSKRWLILQTNYDQGFVLGCPTSTGICGNGVLWGLSTDRPMPGDYDGDGKTDIAVWRPSNGGWYYLSSSSASTGNTPGFGSVRFWGANGDIPQPADYDGDGKMDFAVFRPSANPANNFWYIRRTLDGASVVVEWGSPGDQPASAPYTVE